MKLLRDLVFLAFHYINFTCDQMSVLTYYVAKLEMKRVQNYLFQIPQLTIALGANVCLGEVGRGVLENENSNRFSSSPTSLPSLATDCGARFPGGEDLTIRLLTELEKVFGADDFSFIREEDDVPDPLVIGEKPQDRPLELAIETGILVRDASRIEAIFPNKDAAESFVEKSRCLLNLELPGVNLSAVITEISDSVETGGTSESNSWKIWPKYTSEIPFDLPDGVACEWSPHALAEDTISYTDKDKRRKEIFVSESVKRRREAALRFNQGKSRDVLGMMNSSIFSKLDLSKQEVITDFKALAGSNLLAVIHADGNQVGRRVSLINRYLNSRLEIARGSASDWLFREAFFYRNRKGVRCAIAKAWKGLFEGTAAIASEKEVYDQVRMLMVGGDDILIACDARLAIPFVLEMCRALTDFTGIETKIDDPQLAAAYKPLTLGIGIAFVQPSFPFIQAHQLAEELAKSAKRLAADKPDQHVVDWAFSKASMKDSLVASRCRDYLLRDSEFTFSMNCRPYQVLGESNSLEQLWGDAVQLQNCPSSTISRSQLRTLEEGFSRGPSSALVAAYELPAKMRRKLTEMGYLGEPNFGQSVDPLEFVWSTAQSGFRESHLIDLMELFELARLPKFKSREK